MSADASELKGFADDLMRLEPKIAKQVEAVVFKGAMNVKKDMRAEARSSRSFKGIAPSIDFDITNDANGVEAEIGPAHGPGEPGNLANIAYFGTSRGGGTVNFIRPFEEETPRFVKAMGDVMRDVL